MNRGKMIDDHVLVIAYGNPLRCDDGVAWQAAEEIRRKLPALTQIICVHQLTPELAEEVSRADTVIFLDASRSGKPGKVECRTVIAEDSRLDFSHHLAPAQVLGLCGQLYDAGPRGFLISIGGQCFDHGEELSPAAINALPETVAAVNELVRRVGASSGQGDAQPAIV